MSADFTVNIQVFDVDGNRGYDVKLENRAPELGSTQVVEACLMGALIVARKHNISDELVERLRLLMKVDRKATLGRN